MLQGQDGKPFDLTGNWTEIYRREGDTWKKQLGVRARNGKCRARHFFRFVQSPQIDQSNAVLLTVSLPELKPAKYQGSAHGQSHLGAGF
jgi:hypothetical protein